MSAFPPIRSHQSQPISSTEALQRLQTHLIATQTKPFLLPNATLQSDGPKAQGDSNANLVIHNLKRVEAGLRGEWLAPSLELEGGMAGMISIAGSGAGKAGTGLENETEGDGWQDLDEYQREQSIGAGELEPRQTGLGQEGDDAMPVDVEVLDNEAAEALAKEERKAAKKQRKLLEKGQRHQKQPNFSSGFGSST